MVKRGLLVGLALITVSLWCVSEGHAQLGPVRVYGTVTDQAGQPIPEARVSLRGYTVDQATNDNEWNVFFSTTTTIDGEYEFVEVPLPSFFEVRAWHPGYQAAKQRAHLLDDETEYAVHLTLVPAGPATVRLEGTVTNSQDEPLVGATVSLTPLAYSWEDAGSVQSLSESHAISLIFPISAITDGNGQYALPAVPVTRGLRYLIRVVRSGYHPISRPIHLQPGETNTADFVLESIGEADVARVEGTVYGVANDPANVVPDATVTIVAANTGLPKRVVGQVVTDDQGQYAFPEVTVLPDVSYHLMARHPDYQPHQQTIAPVPGTVNVVDVIFQAIPPNRPPVAKASAVPTEGHAPLRTQFSSEGSKDPDGDGLSILWDFGDHAISNDPNPTHVYERPGDYVATLTVTDGQGAQASDTVTILVTSTPPIPLPPIIEAPDHVEGQVGALVEFTVTASTRPIAPDPSILHPTHPPVTTVLSSPPREDQIVLPGHFLPRIVLLAERLPEGARFVPARIVGWGKTSGSFHWIPASEQVGEHTATFLAYNLQGFILQGVVSETAAAELPTEEWTALIRRYPDLPVVSRHVVTLSITPAPEPDPLFCGGIVGLPCPDGLVCVDHPGDSCDPAHGGADCGGICVKPDPEPDPKPDPRGECMRGGCSGQICADGPVITTCEWRPEYACYRTAGCARQADDQCGWTMTDELRTCIDNAGRPDPEPLCDPATLEPDCRCVGNAVVCQVPDPEPTPPTIPGGDVDDDDGVIFGDVDGNGEVQAYDGALIAQHVAGVSTLTANQLVAAEVTQNGSVTDFDAQVVGNYVVGRLDRLPIRMGDVDHDGVVTLADADLTGQASVGLVTLSAHQAFVADVDGNGRIQAYDAALIAQYAKGIIEGFPVELEPDPTPENHPPVLTGLYKLKRATLDEQGRVILRAKKKGYFYVKGSDPEGGELTYRITDLPSRASWSSSRGRFKWEPKKRDVGTHVVRITAVDPQGLASEPLVVTVVVRR